MIMKETKILRFVEIEGIPSWALPYFEYGQEANLPEEDEALIKQWQKENPDLWYLGEVESEGFNPYPAFGKTCDTYRCRFEKIPRKRKSKKVVNKI